MRWWRGRQRLAWLHEGPVDRGPRWVADVNRPMTEAEEEAIRRSVNRGTPWQKRTAARLGIESALRPRGRPPKRKPREEQNKGDILLFA